MHVAPSTERSIAAIIAAIEAVPGVDALVGMFCNFAMQSENKKYSFIISDGTNSFVESSF